MKKIITILCVITILAGGLTAPAGAALNAVSPAVDPVNGFPLWYEDSNLLRLGQCLDFNAFCINPQLTLPNQALPLSFPTNFPAEVFYWNATAKIADPAVDATLVLALEGTLPVPAAGQQTVFARIRFTINPRVAAAANVPMTVTHPFGSISVTTRAIGQRLLVTQDVGVAAGIFTGALLNAGAGGIVNVDGISIGPFLTAAAPAPARIKDPVTGNTYIGDGVTAIALTGSPVGTNFFQIVGPVGSGVNATQTGFTLVGKVSGCVAGIVAPTAVPDPGAAAASGQAQVINVTANDIPGTTPAVAPAVTPTPMPINKASIAITVPPTGGTAVPNLDGTVTYTPNATFLGTDSFTYTVADNCGTASNAVAVPIIVEKLVASKAEYRPKLGKWTVTGQSSQGAGKVITVLKGDAAGPAIGTTPVKADGTFKFVGKSKVPPGSPAAAQNISVQSEAKVTTAAPLTVK